MKLQTEHVGGVTIVTLVGELDSRGNQLLDKKLKELSTDGSFRIVLDLSSIRFMGSQTISLLISNLKEIRAGGGDVRFLNPQRSVTQYLKQNRIFEIFRIYSTRADAIQSYETVEKNLAKPQPNVAPVETAKDESPLRQASAVMVDDSVDSMNNKLHTGEILYANSCILATLVKTLESKGVLSSSEASELLSYEILPKKS